VRRQAAFANCRLVNLRLAQVFPKVCDEERANPRGTEGAFGYTIPKNVLKNTLQGNRSSISETEIRKRYG
jgi:hypothetical protein